MPERFEDTLRAREATADTTEGAMLGKFNIVLTAAERDALADAVEALRRIVTPSYVGDYTPEARSALARLDGAA
jgi:hypothetical protein